MTTDTRTCVRCGITQQTNMFTGNDTTCAICRGNDTKKMLDEWAAEEKALPKPQVRVSTYQKTTGTIVVHAEIDIDKDDGKIAWDFLHFVVDKFLPNIITENSRWSDEISDETWGSITRYEDLY